MLGRPAIVDLDARDNHAGDIGRTAASAGGAVDGLAAEAAGAPVSEARLFEIGEIDRVVDVAHRVAVAEAHLELVREDRRHCGPRRPTGPVAPRAHARR